MTKGFLALALISIGGAAYAQTSQTPAATTPATTTTAQQPAARPASPAGSAHTQVAGSFVKDEKGRERYRDGKWLEITYGRPIKRGRDVFGSGADYGKTLYAGAPVWRAGADQATRLTTEVPLLIGGKTVPAGSYNLYVELKSPTEWTLIVSSWGAKKTGNDPTPDTLWGAYNYTPDKDVVRVPMTVAKSPASIDQLTWGFCDMTAEGGKMFLAWDTTNAMVSFTVAK
jgi:hypothetical protein